MGAIAAILDGHEKYGPAMARLLACNKAWAEVSMKWFGGILLGGSHIIDIRT